MQLLSEAIDSFSAAAERLDDAIMRAGRRAEARADGCEAQGDVILRLRGEVEALKKALAERAPAEREPERPAGPNERIEPYWAAG